MRMILPNKIIRVDRDDFGWVIYKPYINAFNKAINQAALLDDNSLRVKINKVKVHVRQNYAMKTISRTLILS